MKKKSPIEYSPGPDSTSNLAGTKRQQ